MPNPWVFMVSGTLLTIVSTGVAWFTLHRLESSKAIIAKQIANTKMALEECRTKAANAEVLWGFAELAGAASLPSATTKAFYAIVTRLEAAGEDGRAEAERLLAVKNDPAELAGEWNKALPKYVERHNDLVSQTDSLTDQLIKAEASVYKSRSLATAFQILGVLTILVKDLPAGL